MSRLFLDTEFTGLTQHTSLLSLAIVDRYDNSFYAEFTDHNSALIDPWIQDNVMKQMRWLDHPNIVPFADETTSETNMGEKRQLWVYGDRSKIVEELIEWLETYQNIEFWADCPTYDWMLFCELFGGSLHLPKNISYVIHDLATLLRVKRIDSLTPREQLVTPPEGVRHNALYDAMLTKACVEELL